MAYDKLRLYRKYIALLFKFGTSLLYQRVQAIAHRWTYRETPSPKNVVIIGGSFAGVFLAKRLAESLPTGYRVVLIEKNSHFNYLFNFPRYSVLRGHETKAFIPYDGLARDACKGIFERIQDLATDIGDGEVELKSGNRVQFEYLAIATGTSQNRPAQVKSTEKEDGCAELRSFQEQIETAKNIAIVGGGPVGVQLATDIKSYYHDKRVVLIHSRSQLLPNFGKRLHDYVMGAMAEMGVRVMLERPQLPSGGGAMTLQFKDGGSEDFDLVIPCTGQSPNSSIVARLGPEAISPKNGRIKVKPTLQVLLDDVPHTNYSHIFSLGDVADTPGPKMARAGIVQADIVTSNILSLIKKKNNLKLYKPDPVEGALKLSLGKADSVLYLNDSHGEDILVPVKSKNEDLEIEKAWKMFNAKA